MDKLPKLSLIECITIGGLIGLFIVVSIIAITMAGEIKEQGRVYTQKLIDCEQKRSGVLLPGGKLCIKADALIWNWESK